MVGKKVVVVDPLNWCLHAGRMGSIRRRFELI
jgi:hypothetical protein